MISEDMILRVKDENDIVDVISDDVRLQKAGTNYKGLCPFHGEKTASFVVSREKQIYKCFGCGEAGNVISYVMKTKNKTFPEACRLLAERVGIDIPEFRREKDEVYQKKKRLIQLNVDAARSFFNNLTLDKEAREYFNKRKISEKTSKKFGLGFAKDSWNSLLNEMKKKGYSEEELLQAGLVSKSEKGRIFDKFRNRIMFPVFNVKGEVIGFGGRVMDDSNPKYLNSPETIIFKKGTNLYGLNFAIKGNDIKSRKIIIVEGYMDFLALQQSGISNVAASLGTAFTQNQAKLLKRYADTVILCFDSDKAGRKAAERSIEILEQTGFETKILRIPEGKDPDDYLKHHGREEFLSLVDNAYNLIQYEIVLESEKYNLKTQEGKINFVRGCAKILSKASPIEQEIYVKNIARKTGITEQRIFDEIGLRARHKDKNLNNMNENGKNSQNLYLEPAFLKAEKSLIRLMLEKKLHSKIMAKIENIEFNSDIHKIIISLAEKANEEGIENIVEYIESHAQDGGIISELVRINEIELVDDDAVDVLVNNCIKEISSYNYSIKKERLLDEMKESEKKGDIKRCLEIASELKKLEERI